MRKKRFIGTKLRRKLWRRVPLVGLAAGVAISLHACGSAEAEPQPDPAEVARFLAELDTKKQLASGEAERKDGTTKRIRQLVEGAATRAPSVPVINKLETVVAGRLG